MVIQGEFTLGSLGAFIEYSMNIVWPMEMLGWLTNSFSAAVGSNKKLKKIYAETASITEHAQPEVIEEVKGKIVFDNILFRGG